MKITNIVRFRQQGFSTVGNLAISRTKAPEFQFEIGNQAAFGRYCPKWFPMRDSSRWKRLYYCLTEKSAPSMAIAVKCLAILVLIKSPASLISSRFLNSAFYRREAYLAHLEPENRTILLIVSSLSWQWSTIFIVERRLELSRSIFSISRYIWIEFS